MKTLLLIVLAVTALAGCVVAPAGPDVSFSYGYYDRYGYNYPYTYSSYPYRQSYYRHRYYWQTP